MPAPDGGRDLIPYVGSNTGGRGVSMQRERLPVTALVTRPCVSCGVPVDCLPVQASFAECAACGAAARLEEMQALRDAGFD